jgi:serine/threonine-protein kinase
LFSLGIVLYELLAHELPFPNLEQRSATQSIRHDPPPQLSRRVDGVPAPLDRIVHRCLEKLPSDRFGSSAELVSQLQQVLDSAGVKSRQRVIGEALVGAKLVDTALEGDPEPVPSVAPQSKPTTLGPALRGLLLAFGLIVAGGGFIQIQAYRQGARLHARHAPTRLELVPKNAAYLRVVATPWAHVSVDGERVETTPFSRPIPLEAGVHYVRLEHPNATTERRTVELVPGETILLDVKMQVSPEAIAKAAGSTEPKGVAPGPSAKPNGSVDNSP